ncbi:MAG: hypothetical protein JST64_14280 [Actinobacteria bacterium]|nr:hypothetical protein [Actinomycetota bacterium]
MRKFLVLVVAVSSASLVLGACSKDDSSSSTSTTTTTKESPSKGSTGGSGTKSFSVDTPEGQASLSLDGQLPPNWPNDFPAPKQSEVAGSGSLARSDSGVMVGVYTTKQSASSVYEAYKSNADLKVSGAKSATIGGVFAGRMSIGGTYDGSITVTAIDGTTYVVVVLKGGGGSASSSSSSSSTSTPSSSSTSTSTAG